MKKKRKYLPVLIVWDDSTGVTGEWERKNEEKLKPVCIMTLGFLVEKTKKYITVCQNISKEQICGKISIPKGCIKSIQFLNW